MKGLHNIKPAAGSTRTFKRVGRGNGSGKGSYSGRGIKGQHARAGASGFMARSMRQYLLRIPKVRGFKRVKVEFAIVTLGDLQRSFEDGAIVTPKELVKKGLLDRASMPVKVLVNGTLSKKLTVSAHAYSAQAKEMIAQAGGQANVLEVSVPKKAKDTSKKA